MAPLPPLSRARLETFRACRRRFQLRYLEQLPWPTLPPAESLVRAAEKGQAFHQLLAQHFLGLQPAPESDETLRDWWDTFHRLGPPLPAGERLPELALTVPLGQGRLTGRFDLVIRSPEQLHLYDWKTERQPRSSHLLKEDLQTKLYLLLAVAGASAMGGGSYRPEQVSLTYWFVQAPEQPITFRYSQAEYEASQAQLSVLLDELAALAENEAAPWPLTDNLSLCQQCAYRIYCGRQDVEVKPERLPDWWHEDLDETDDNNIEPDWA